MTSSNTNPEPVKVSVLLTEEATQHINNACMAFGVSRKYFIRTVSDNHHNLYFDDFLVKHEPHASKVQAEVNATFLNEASKALRCKEKYLVASSIFNQLLVQETFDPALLYSPQQTTEIVQDALRWFRFFRSAGISMEQALAIGEAKLLKVEPHPGTTESLVCYGSFRNRYVEPQLFGFRGYFENGELHLSIVLPVH